MTPTATYSQDCPVDRDCPVDPGPSPERRAAEEPVDGYLSWVAVRSVPVEGSTDRRGCGGTPGDGSVGGQPEGERTDRRHADGGATYGDHAQCGAGKGHQPDGEATQAQEPNRDTADGHQAHGHIPDGDDASGVADSVATVVVPATEADIDQW